jgi:hypothetical protein
VLFRREVYWQAGGADERLTFCGDWKMWASMALEGGAISYVGEALSYYRFHDASVTEKSQRSGKSLAEALDVIAWILRRVSLEEMERSKVCDEFSSLWISAVLNRRIPASLRWAILKNARAVDRHALRRLVRPAVTAIRLTLARRWRSSRIV